MLEIRNLIVQFLRFQKKIVQFLPKEIQIVIVRVNLNHAYSQRNRIKKF